MLIATPGATNANAYLSLAEAEPYLTQQRLHTVVWSADTTTDEDKEKAIIWATSILDRLMDWYGSIRSVGQALRWPRSGVSDPDYRFYNYDSIPTVLKNATAELANLMLQKDREAVPDLLGQGFKRIDVKDVISLEVNSQEVLPLIPSTILGMLYPLGQLADGVGNQSSGGFREMRVQRT